MRILRLALEHPLASFFLGKATPPPCIRNDLFRLNFCLECTWKTINPGYNHTYTHVQTPRVRDNRESNALKMRLNEAGDEKLGWLGGSEERGFPSQTLSQAQTKVGGTKCKHFRSLFAFLWHFVSASARKKILGWGWGRKMGYICTARWHSLAVCFTHLPIACFSIAFPRAAVFFIQIRCIFMTANK